MAAEVEVAKKENFIESTRAYLADVRGEMKRVTWPAKLQVQSTTAVVILSIFFFAAYFKVVDQIIDMTVVRGYAALVK